MLTSGPLPHCPLVSSLPASETETTNSLYLAGESVEMQRIRAQLHRIAPYFRIALITGEPGTGKETVARVLHGRSAGAGGPFIVWQAATFVERLKADHDRNMLHEAQGGTLFLENLRHVPYDQQPTLLRLFQQLGTRRQDLRFVVATDHELRPLLATGHFHEDLHQRISAVEIGMVPLRKRVADIAGLAEVLLRRKGLRTLSIDAIAQLELHHWPENVRELYQTIERASATAEGRVVEARHLSLPERTLQGETYVDLPMERLDDVVQRHVLDVLSRCSGNKLRTAEILGISRSTLYRMLEAGTIRPGLLQNFQPRTP